jgi:hypothetical protein
LSAAAGRIARRRVRTAAVTASIGISGSSFVRIARRSLPCIGLQRSVHFDRGIAGRLEDRIHELVAARGGALRGDSREQ